MVFILKSKDQISWISTYISHILSKDPIKDKITFHVYAGMEQNHKFESFLFWRAISLLSLKNSGKAAKDGAETYPFAGCPFRINLGRCDFDDLFEKIALEEKTEQHVYSCTGNVVYNLVNSAVRNAEMTTGYKFHYHPEKY